jgi:bacteriocin resistance YdeI/OmpD-like protein/uncharacterized protein DUF1905
MRFRTTILSAGKTAAGIEVPPEVVEALGSGRKPPVKVTINGYTYRSSVATVSGAFMIGVSNDVRRAAGVAAGEEVDVELKLDTEPRVVQVPGDLAEALDADAAARTAFDRLTYSNKRRIVMLVDDAKTPETRQRRIDKSIADLRAGHA